MGLLSLALNRVFVIAQAYIVLLSLARRWRVSRLIIVLRTSTILKLRITVPTDGSTSDVRVTIVREINVSTHV